MCKKPIINERIRENVVKSMVNAFQKDGYHVKTKFRYPISLSKGIQTNGKQVLDIFAYKGSDNRIVIEFENCTSILSHKNEIKWKSLISKPGLNLYLIVPCNCKEKAHFKSKIKNIPVEIYDYTNWKDIFH